MPRILVCYDEIPSQDGSCATQAWIEQPAQALQPLTIEQAEMVGGAFFVGLVTLGAIAALLNPRSSDE